MTHLNEVTNSSTEPLAIIMGIDFFPGNAETGLGDPALD